MNYSPEFIKEAKKIQDIIEPEELMPYQHEAYPDEIFIMGHICEKGFLSENEHVRSYCQPADHDTKAHCILLPSLEWLMMELRRRTWWLEVKSVVGGDEWVVVYRENEYGGSRKESANTPSLAAIRALVKVMGR